MGKNAREWQELAFVCKEIAETAESAGEQWRALADQRGEVIARMWVGVEAMVAPDHPALANSLRQMAMGDLLPGMTINYVDDPEPEDDEEEADDE